MSIFHFFIRPDISIEAAWDELDTAGVEVLYSEEDPESSHPLIIGRLPDGISKEEWMGRLPSVESIQKAEDLSIDWEAQWQAHGLDFREGVVHVSIGGQEFILKPGPGFGDASHPTTRLVLQMMETIVPGQPVIDIGCGSGVLSLAALRLNAAPVYAVDIDPAAIRHTNENAVLNNLEKSLWVGTSEELIAKKPEGRLIALMNMITSEQEEAWQSTAALHDAIGEVIVSGILSEEKEPYLARWKLRGWQAVDLLQEDEWIAIRLDPVCYPNHA